MSDNPNPLNIRLSVSMTSDLRATIAEQALLEYERTNGALPIEQRRLFLDAGMRVSDGVMGIIRQVMTGDASVSRVKTRNDLVAERLRVGDDAAPILMFRDDAVMIG